MKFNTYPTLKDIRKSWNKDFRGNFEGLSNDKIYDPTISSASIPHSSSFWVTFESGK